MTDNNGLDKVLKLQNGADRHSLFLQRRQTWQLQQFEQIQIRNLQRQSDADNSQISGLTPQNDRDESEISAQNVTPKGQNISSLQFQEESVEEEAMEASAMFRGEMNYTDLKAYYERRRE